MKQLLLFSALLLSSATAMAQHDTVAVYFATGKATMTEGVQNQIVDNIYRDVLHSKQTLMIIGYADYVGGNTSNDKLSRARAAAVKRFLMGFGFEDRNITICIGKGEVAREGMTGKAGFAHDRRVDIVTNPDPVQPEPVAAPPEAAALPAPVAAPPKKAVPASAAATLPDLSKVKANETVRLENIYFYPGRHTIRPESTPNLQQLYDALKSNPEVRIVIEGHVCCVRDGIPDAMDEDSHEIALSVNRAKAIYEYLLRKGIDRGRLSYKGFGATRRVSEEHTEEEANRNRRVEIRVL